MHDMPWHSLFCHRRAWLVALVSAVLLALPHTGCSLTAPAPPSSEVSTRNSAVARCRAKASLLRSHVFWAAPFFSGGGYCSEAHDATSGLAKCGVPVQLLPHGDSFNRAFTERLGQDRQNELQQWTVRSLPTRPPRRGEDSQPPTICICHSEPGAWSVPRPNYHTADCPAPGCDYKIGRTMFETDRLPHGWAPRLNAMDELWVPTECQRQVFASNGVVPSKIHVVGESVDSAFFDPSSVQPYFIPARVLQQSSAFGRVVDPAVPPFSDSTVVLLSVFKWEARKAPEVLVKAFCAEFTATDDVLLLVLTNAYHSDSAHESRVTSLRRAQAETLNVPENSMPRIAVLDENLAQADMPRLYKRADAFVLPSRGEGWGRPHLEALSMGLPVIATNWSGPTEFLTQDNSYPLPIAQDLVPVQDGPFQGHLWADPSVPDLRRLIRRVYNATRACRGLEQADTAEHLCNEIKRKRSQARADVIERWSQESLAMQMLERLYAVDVQLAATAHSEL